MSKYPVAYSAENLITLSDDDLRVLLSAMANALTTGSMFSVETTVVRDQEGVLATAINNGTNILLRIHRNGAARLEHTGVNSPNKSFDQITSITVNPDQKTLIFTSASRIYSAHEGELDQVNITALNHDWHVPGKSTGWRKPNT